MSVASPALPARTERFWAALLVATLMNLPLGSVYAFSVPLRPIEQEPAIPRSALSCPQAEAGGAREALGPVPAGRLRHAAGARP